MTTASKTPAKKSYTADSIKTLVFPESIRQKPTLYIGPIDERGILTILREVMDNVVDEALAGRATSCDVFIKANESGNVDGFYVLDDGEGIPVGMMQIAGPDNRFIKVPAIKAILSMLHTSGKFDDSAYTASRGCFTGDTRIRLLNGKTVSMEALHRRWASNKDPIPLMSFNLKTQTLQPSNISHVQITKRTRDLVKVTLDNGESVRCTPDHPFYVNRGGSIRKVRADRLASGDSLVSTYHDLAADGYPTQTEQGTQKKIHRVVGEFYNIVRPGIDEVHHVDRNIHDNRPSNLEVVTKAEHQAEHSDSRSKASYDKIMLNQVELRQENSQRLTEQNADSDFIRVAHATKVIRVGVRALIASGELSQSSYEAARRNSECAWHTALKYFADEDTFVSEVRARYAALVARREISITAERELTQSHSGVSPQEHSANANFAKSVQTWTKVLLSMEDPDSATPIEFNFHNRTGAAVYGRYAALRRWTTLKWLKRHVLEGSELRLHEDLSDEAQERRMIDAEIRMRAPMSLQKMLKGFHTVLTSARIPLNEEAYMAAKSSCHPNWKMATRILELQHGVTLQGLSGWLRSFNHTVAHVVPVKLQNAVPVYDITVDDTHVFFLEPGVLVSNTHGIGVKATNALSTVYDVTTFRDGKWHNVRYERGVLKTDLNKCAAPKHPDTGKPLTKGTLVYFRPDSKVFTVMQDRPLKTIFGVKSATTLSLLEWMRLASYFTPGLTLRISHFQAGSREFHSENGPRDFIARRLLVLNKEREADDAIQPLAEGAEFQFANPLIDVVVSFTTYDAVAVDSFTNGLRNVEGGVHVDAFMGALKAAILPHAGKKVSFTVRELREGLIALINVKLSAPQFDSQTKEKLVDERAGAPVEEFLTAELTKFFAKNKKLAQAIIERATNLSALRSKFMASKKVVSALRNASKKGLSIKATVAPNCKPEDRELFLVEGDSAGGTVKSARFHEFQETLPLKGKVTNAARFKDDKVLASDEIINILAQIGFDPKAEDIYAKLRVGKIISLADPDADGPLHGDTKLDIRWEGKWQTITMAELAQDPWTTRTFEVLAWNGSSFYIAEASDCRVTLNTNRMVRIRFSDGSKLEAAPNHKFALHPDCRFDQRVQDTLSNGLRMVTAERLKCGDRLASADVSKLPHNRTGRAAVEVKYVTKVKVYDTEVLTPVYCLTVPGQHNFVLHNGVISKNCHINALLLTLLYKFLPKLFDLGMIYVAEVPEFYAMSKDKKLYTADTAEKLANILKDANVRADVQHIKGYGEVNADILRALAFDPASRTLTQIVPSETPEGEVEFFKLMGNSSESRKRLLGV